MSDYYELLVEDLLKNQDEPILISLGNAIAEILRIAKNNPRAKWKGVPKKNDMSRHVYILITPIVNEILQSIHESWRITNLLPRFTPSAGTEDMRMTACSLYEFIYPHAEGVYKDAANYLHLFLVNIVKKFQPSSTVIPAKQVEFCIYCYREVDGNTKEKFAKTTCHKHSDERRTHGKYHANRFQEMSFYFNRNKRKKSIKTYQTNLLKKLGIPEYTNQNLEEWLKIALRRTDACSWKEGMPQKYMTALAKMQRLVGMHDVSQGTYVMPWPSIFNGTMLRYAAYNLAKTRRPSVKVAKRLEDIWGCDKPNFKELAAKYKVSRQILHRQVKKWESVINGLREQGLDDKTIKIALNLKFTLPHLITFV